MKLVHFDLQSPPLLQAARYLLASVIQPASANGSPPVVVVPGKRAGRRLLELLVEEAAAVGKPLVPPTIITLARLPEMLYQPQRQLADDTTQHLAWISAMRATPREQLSQFCPALPEVDDLIGWLRLAELLTELHNELAAHLLDFSDVAKDGDSLGAFNESSRWKLLAGLQAKYLRVLDDLQVWDRQTARQVAIEKHECQIDRPVVLVGTVDLNRAQRKMLDQVSGQVTSLVFAAPSWRDRFDAHGCVIPQAWEHAPIDVETRQISVVDGPSDQADTVIRELAALDGRYREDEITLGMVDARLVPTVLQRLEECDLRGRYGPGTPLVATGPYRLLAATAEYLQSHRFDDFAALVRQPALITYIGRHVKGDWLSKCDQYATDHLPWRIDGSWFPKSPASTVVQQVHECVERWLSELRQGERPWSDWGKPIVQLLLTTYGADQLDAAQASDRGVADACEAIADGLQKQASVHPALAPRVSGSLALQLALRNLQSATIPPTDPDGIEMLGWLDLPWDDAPVLMLIGFNEEKVPSRRGGDLFLPNALRRHLELEDDGHMYARDAYALALIAATRTQLRVIAGRRTVEGDPLLPSRLLFACDEQTAAQRALSWFGEQRSKPRIVLPKGLRSGAKNSKFLPPMPRKLEQPIESLRVTQFKAYLACPYRFYLDHCERLKALTDEVEELDGGQFGTLLHTVLKHFADSDLSTSVSEEEIYEGLSSVLDRELRHDFGAEPLPAVMIQAEQARERLRGFARWQAGRSREGWQIRFSEKPFDDLDVKLVVDHQPMKLKGRVDRIDFNEQQNRWALLDYKTGDSTKKPDPEHRLRDGTWVDLQLPLYRHLAGPLDMQGPIDLGYIGLSKTKDNVGLFLAEWSSDDLAEAEEAAATVVRKIRQELFWPPSTEVNELWDQYAALLAGFTDDEAAAARSV